MSDDEDEEKDSTKLTYLEARPFLVDIKDEAQEEHKPAPSDTPSAILNPSNPGLSQRFWIAAAVNSISTVSIVFVNKQIFTNPSLRHTQVAFAAFHFITTYLFLYATSHPRLPFKLFTPKLFPPLTILPLALAMIANVVLMNASLAYSSIQFYQIVRVLLTPCVALLNLVLYGLTIPMRAAAMLVPVCVGVGVVSYFDAVATTGVEKKETSSLGMLFGFSALAASAIHTVWIGKYHRMLQCSSMQLLMNQAPVSVAVMVYLVPFTDDVTAFRGVGARDWGLILISGGLAVLINLSQFLIISEAGPVSSTVVGHFKTCSIIAMGWVVSGKQLKDGSLLGVALAVGGIILPIALPQPLPPSQSPSGKPTLFMTCPISLVCGTEGIVELFQKRDKIVHGNVAHMHQQEQICRVPDEIKPTHAIECAAKTPARTSPGWIYLYLREDVIGMW